MSREIQVYTGDILDVPEIIRASAVVEEEKDRNLIQPLGVVCYDQQRKLALISETPDHSLSVRHQDYVDGFIEAAELVGWGERIAYLDEFAHTSIAQVNLTSATIRKHRSLRGRDMLGATLPFVHANSGRIDNIVLNEQELLRVFVGETGRIASFEGADRAAETALVVGKEVNEETIGLVFVFHSADYSVDLDSITGLEAFLSSYNEQMRHITASLELDKWIESYEQLLKSGEIKFETTVREQIYRARVTSLARLFELTKNEKYQDELTTHLSGPEDNGRTFLSRFFSSKTNTSVVDRTKLTNNAVDKFIGEGKEKKVKPDSIFRKLKSPYHRDLRIQIGNQFGVPGEGMQAYVQAIAHSIHYADDRALDDITLLINEMINDGDYRRADDSKDPNVRGWYIPEPDLDKTLISIEFNSRYAGSINKTQAMYKLLEVVQLRKNKLAMLRIQDVKAIESQAPRGGGGF